jgi:hypothetical protein
MPLASDLHTFDKDNIMRTPTGKGVYSLHKAGETIYISKAEGEDGVRGELLSHLYGKDSCTKQATTFSYEFHGNPVAREEELLSEYMLAHSRLPICNVRTD